MGVVFMLIRRKRFYMICVGLFTHSAVFLGPMAPTLGRSSFPHPAGHRRRSAAADFAGDPGGEFSVKKGAWRWIYTGMGVVTPASVPPGRLDRHNFSWGWIFFH
jgi:hypothetical protein